MATPNTLAMFQAKIREAFYRTFSRLPRVSRRTPTNFASSSCFKPSLARYSRMRFLIIRRPPLLPQLQEKECGGKGQDAQGKDEAEGGTDRLVASVYGCEVEHQLHK